MRHFVRRLSFCLLAASSLFAGSIGAQAQIPMSGNFVAEARCPALRSIRDPSNPGTVATEPGESYRLLGRNTDEASHYLIEVPGAEPPRRWVAIGCGRVEPGGASVSAAASRPHSDAPANRSFKSASESMDYVLAISWHSAFCEGAPTARECRTPPATRAEATRFSLHGLWPQPESRAYCGVDAAEVSVDKNGRWRALPEIRLTPATANALRRAMPGTEAGLDRHEWVKHGSCSGLEPDAYFTAALGLLESINKSRVQALFAGALDQYLSQREIRKAFDRSFGAGAGSRVEILCRRDGQRRIITELRISIVGQPHEDTTLRRLIAEAQPVRDTGCRGGTVDPVGLQ